ncbi:Uncharacterised protein [Serratia rubidaea]|uniref:Uncharacterized protein n=1 Tax=Serratia rubidaea TaxID=61652 RepID=A0A447QNI0_SERRU|nr:Uncharacterised protein [Serratia rubidaea]
MLDPFATAIPDRLRHRNAGVAQGVQPEQLTFNILTIVIIATVNAQRKPAAAMGDLQGGIFRTAQQPDRGARVLRIVGQRPIGQPEDRLVTQGVVLFRAHVQLRCF